MRLHMLWFTGLLVCQGAVAGEDAVKLRITNKLKSMMPKVAITAIKPAPVKGLYEVEMGSNIVYISEDARFVVVGDIRDIDQNRNLTEERRGQARLSALKSVKPEQVVEFAPAKTKHLMYVFTDIDCGYCRKFHQEVGALNEAGIAVRYLAFPRAGIDSDSYKKAVSVWCAKDSKTALTDAKSGKDIPPATCENPVKQQYELGQALGVKGTPTIILDSGQEIGGYVPANQLVHYFQPDDPDPAN
jgi:thiol:disulfide interchange protein DsbC